MKLGGSQINSADFKRTSFPTSFFILFVPHGRVDVDKGPFDDMLS